MRSLLAASTVMGFLSFAQTGCTRAPLPAPVSQAEAVLRSDAAIDAKEFAPQAHAAAEKLKAEAIWLHGEGLDDESAAAGEQAIAALNEAFALARLAKAQERSESATTLRNEAAEELAEVDRMQSQVAADADAFEMRARVQLDKEEVKDVESISPERATARRAAAVQLTAEGRLLCLSTRLLNKDAKGLTEAEEKVSVLEKELSVGSAKDDLYPRAAAARANCLTQLTEVRRPSIQAAPESANSDRLLVALTESGKVFAYRDDRGIVINIGSPLDSKGELNEPAAQALSLLGGTAKEHPQFPLMLAVHTAKNGENKRATQMGDKATAALTAAGAPTITIHHVLGAKPLVSTRIRGADEKNERLEVVFVIPGR